MSLFSYLSQREIYSDITKDMVKSPINRDVMKKANDAAVKEALKNLLMTRKGERLFHPEIGCGLKDMIFDILTPDKVVLIKELIKETIENHEPRVNVIDIDVLPDIDSGKINITLVFNVINIETPVTYTITVERIR